MDDWWVLCCSAERDLGVLIVKHQRQSRTILLTRLRATDRLEDERLGEGANHGVSVVDSARGRAVTPIRHVDVRVQVGRELEGESHLADTDAEARRR